MKRLLDILDMFKLRRQTSASIAKERLQIIIAHERSHRQEGKVNLQELQMKLVHVIAEYLHIPENAVKVELERDADRAVLELNVTLPDTVPETV